MATGQVLGMYELVQEIMLHLPLRDMLLARRISKAFDDVFPGSHVVRRAVFPLPTSKVLFLNYARAGDALAWEGPSYFKHTWTDRPRYNMDDGRSKGYDDFSKRPTLNPFIDTYVHKLIRNDAHVKLTQTSPEHSNSLPLKAALDGKTTMIATTVHQNGKRYASFHTKVIRPQLPWYTWRHDAHPFTGGATIVASVRDLYEKDFHDGYIPCSR